MEGFKSARKAEKGKCNVCSRETEKRCSSCHGAYYCSVEHQHKDWKSHKTCCSPVRFEDDPLQNTGAGKYAVATRDLSPGTIVLEERPLFQAPLDSIDVSCIACGLSLPPMNERTSANSCSNCHIPVCGDECAKHPIHAQNECLLFKPNNTVYPFEGCNFLNADFRPEMLCLMLRCSGIMVGDPTLWKQLMKMADWEPTCDANSSDLCKVCDRSLLPATMPRIARFICKGQKICFQSEFFEEGQKIVKLFTTQGYNIYVVDESGRSDPSKSVPVRAGKFIYKNARHVTHSCVGNCEWEIGPFPDFKIRIRTVVPVKRGQTLTTSRIEYSSHILQGTLRRQEKLHENFRSSCRCELCKDPTEFETYQSAVVCRCTRGFLLPLDPLCTEEDSPWKCDTCPLVRPASEFIPEIHQVGIGLLARSVDPEDVFFQSPLELYKGVRQIFDGNILHPNHWVLQLNTIILMGKHAFENKGDAEEGMRYLLDIQNKTLKSSPYGRMVNIVSLCELIMERIAPTDEAANLDSKTKDEILGLRDEIVNLLPLQEEAFAFHKTRFPPRAGSGEWSGETETLIYLKNHMEFAKRLLNAIEARLNGKCGTCRASHAARAGAHCM